MKDLYKVRELISQHLPKYCRYKLKVVQDDDCQHITYNDYFVVESIIFDGNIGFDNMWDFWLEHQDIEHISLDDIFEEVGEYLSEIKVKKIDEGEL